MLRVGRCPNNQGFAGRLKLLEVEIVRGNKTTRGLQRGLIVRCSRYPNDQGIAER